MKLLKFKAKNFKNLKDIEITFSDYNLISGDNGSGKSSILQGISYCLTDKLPEKLSEYIKWGENSFELFLEFEHNKDLCSYSVKYSSTSKKDLIVNGVTHYKNSDAVNYIAKITNPDLLLYSSISEQGQSYSILQESPADRLKRFKTILGIDRLSKIVENLKKQISENKLKSDLIKKEIDILSSKQFLYLEEFELPNISDILSKLKDQESHKKIYEANRIIRSKYDIDLNNYYDSVANLKVLISEQESAKKKLNSYVSGDFDDSLYNQLLNNKKEYEIYKSDFENKKQNRETYLIRQSSIKDKITILEEKKSAIKLYRVKNLDYDQSYLDSLNTSIQNLSIKLKQLKTHESLAKEGKCPSCGQEFKHDINSLRLDIETTKSELDTLQSEYQMRKSGLEDFQKKFIENSKSKEIIKLYDEQIENLKSELIELVEVKEPGNFNYDIGFLTTLENLEKEKQNYEKSKSFIDVLKKQINTFEFEIDRLSKLTQPVEPVYDSHSFEEILYESLKRDLNIYEEKKSKLEFIQEHNKKIKEDEKNHKNLLKDKETVYYSNMNEISVLEETRNILDKQFSSYLIEKGTEYIEFQMNRFFQKCYNKYSVYFRQTESKNSIDFYYSDISGKGGSASLCSGFEKQLLSIAFRVALASITGLGFLILDEIDSDASEENSITLYSNLIESNLFNQIITISHKEDTKEHLLNNYKTKLIEIGDV